MGKGDKMGKGMDWKKYLENIMKKRQITDKQRMDLFRHQYKRMLEERRGHNYEYWNEKHEAMIDSGKWQLYKFSLNDKREDDAISDENEAKKVVTELRASGHYARIVCGWEKTIQRLKMFSIIYRAKKIY